MPEACLRHDRCAAVPAAPWLRAGCLEQASTRASSHPNQTRPPATTGGSRLFAALSTRTYCPDRTAVRISV